MDNFKQKTVYILIIIAFLFILLAILIFTKKGYENKPYTMFAYILLFLSGIIFFWGQFFSDITPYWIGIGFAIFLILVFLIVSFTLKYFKLNFGNLAGIPIVYALAMIINRYESKICSFISKIIHK